MYKSNQWIGTFISFVFLAKHTQNKALQGGAVLYTCKFGGYRLHWLTTSKGPPAPAGSWGDESPLEIPLPKTRFVTFHQNRAQFHHIWLGGYATAEIQADPTTWLCAQPIQLVMAKAWGDQSHLRGLASWTRLPWVDRRSSAGLAARAPLGTRTGSFPSCLPPDYHAYMCSHLLVYVMCLYHSPTARRPWSRCATFLGGWRLARGPIAPPLRPVRYVVALFWA